MVHCQPSTAKIDRYPCRNTGTMLQFTRYCKNIYTELPVVDYLKTIAVVLLLVLFHRDKEEQVKKDGTVETVLKSIMQRLNDPQAQHASCNK